MLNPMDFKEAIEICIEELMPRCFSTFNRSKMSISQLYESIALFHGFLNVLYIP